MPFWGFNSRSTFSETQVIKIIFFKRKPFFRLGPLRKQTYSLSVPLSSLGTQSINSNCQVFQTHHYRHRTPCSLREHVLAQNDMILQQPRISRQGRAQWRHARWRRCCSSFSSFILKVMIEVLRWSRCWRKLSTVNGSCIGDRERK